MEVLLAMRRGISFLRGERVCSAPVLRGGCNLARKNTVNSTATGPVCLVQKRRSNMTFRVHGAPPVLDHGPAFNPSPRLGIATDSLSAFHPRDDIGVARRLIFIYAGINIPLKIAGKRKWKYLISVKRFPAKYTRILDEWRLLLFFFLFEEIDREVIVNEICCRKLFIFTNLLSNFLILFWNKYYPYLEKRYSSRTKMY